MKKGIEYISSRDKRALDLIGGTALFPILLPPAIIIGAGVAVDIKEPNPFFVQGRVGRDRQLFEAMKFRTIARTAMDTSTTRGTFDTRASEWGQVIRQSGLDEIPQLFNILAGDMSLVGPRPMIEKDIDDMEFAAPELFEDWLEGYMVGKPGLAGPSQVYRHRFRDGKSREIYRRSVELDLGYFAKASLIEDLRILAHTPIDMFRANVDVIENIDVPNGNNPVI